MALDTCALVSDLKNLIAIPSYEDGSGVADYIIRELRRAGLKPKKDRHGNVILALGKGEGVLLNAHMDTVGIGGWEDRALMPAERNGRIYGRGASDTKSGIAAMMEIARKMKDAKLKRRVIFLFSVNEEDSRLEENGAYLASKALKGMKVREGIIFEPTFKGKVLNVGIGCKGAYRFHITVLGRPCHSSKPDLGINPIYLANDFVSDFRKLSVPAKTFEVNGKPVRLSPVFSVTQMKADEGTNVIPSKCVLGIDYRALPGEKFAGVRARIFDLCRKHFRHGFQADEYCIEGYFGYEKRMLEVIGQAAARHGYKADFGIRAGRNDGCIFSNFAGIKCVCFGCGESGQSHTIDESVTIKGFVDCSGMIYEVIREMCTF